MERLSPPTKSIEELAREQGVTAGSLDGWLADHEPLPEDGQDFDAWLAEIRGKARPAARGKAS